MKIAKFVHIRNRKLRLSVGGLLLYTMRKAHRHCDTVMYAMSCSLQCHACVSHIMWSSFIVQAMLGLRCNSCITKGITQLRQVVE